MDLKSKPNLHVLSYYIRKAHRRGDLNTAKKYMRLICKSEINPHIAEKSRILEALDDILRSSHSKIPCMLARVCKKFVEFYIDENRSYLKSGTKNGNERSREDKLVTSTNKLKLCPSTPPQGQQ